MSAAVAAADGVPVLKASSEVGDATAGLEAAFGFATTRRYDGSYESSQVSFPGA
jgi:hypothetical protein